MSVSHRQPNCDFRGIFELFNSPKHKIDVKPEIKYENYEAKGQTSQLLLQFLKLPQVFPKP